jgi:hypothetical protein
LIDTIFATANDFRTTAVSQIVQHCEPAYNFCADDKPVVVSALRNQNPSIRSLDRTLEMGGRVWSML